MGQSAPSKVNLRRVGRAPEYDAVNYRVRRCDLRSTEGAFHRSGELAFGTIIGMFAARLMHDLPACWN